MSDALSTHALPQSDHFAFVQRCSLLVCLRNNRTFARLPLCQYENRDGTKLPLIVRKSDGGFNYATTDLAAVRQRSKMASADGGEESDRVLYVTDAGQAQHFEMVFKAARLAGFVPDSASLEHVPFGLVQGEDGKKFATRSGDTVKLKDLSLIHI